MELTNETSIKAPEVIYELVVDFGEDGTMTIFSSKSELVVSEALNRFVEGDYTGLDIDGYNAKDVIGVSINQTIEAPTDSVSVVTFGNTQQIFIELYSAKVEQ